MPFALLIASLNRRRPGRPVLGPYRARATILPPPKKPWWRYLLCFFGVHPWDRERTCPHCGTTEHFDYPAGHGPC
jgi:hypothetical protein